MTGLAFSVLVCAMLALALAAVTAQSWRRSRAYAAGAHAAANDAVERRYNVLEAIREGLYVVDGDVRVTHINEEAERLLDITADLIVGVELEKVVDPLGSELVPDIRAARRSGVAIERIHAFPSLQRWVEVRILPAADETLISLQDVSAQTIAETQLHENAHSLQLVADNVDAVLWTVGRNGRFTAVSGGGVGRLGLSADDLIGESCVAFVAEDVVRDVFTGRHARVETQHGDRWLRHHVEPLADREQVIVGAVGVSLDITELKRTQRQLFEAAHRDRLTGLPNRFSLDQRLNETVALARDDGRRFALLFLDLDRFKTINDTMGHAAGDDVLREAALRLKAALRDNDFIARPGGDEFVVLLPRIASHLDVEFLSRRLVDALATPIRLGDRDVFIGVSVGAAIYPDHGTDADSLTAHADAAMYSAKAGGGSNLAIYENAMQEQATERFAIEADLRHALARGEFEVHFQPLVDLASERVCGCEALVRWRHPVRGLVPPAIFIPIAEDSSAIVEIDRYVLREACAAAAAFRAIVPDFRVAVNLSGRDLREADLCTAVATALAQHGVPSSALIMEIAETAVLDQDVSPTLERLRDLGVQIAMDDFGVGYSSLAHLKRLPITMLKIDRTFVAGVADNDSDRAIVGAIVSVAKAFGMRVVAEGIETEEQADFIKAIGCDDGQGFKYGRPQTREQLVTLLSSPRRGNLRLVETRTA